EVSVQGALHVLGVKDVLDTKMLELASWEPKELVPAFVEVVDGAVRLGRPHDLRHGVGKLPKLAFTSPQRLFRLSAFGDVAEDQHRPDGGLLPDTDRGGTIINGPLPAILGDQDSMIG